MRTTLTAAVVLAAVAFVGAAVSPASTRAAEGPTKNEQSGVLYHVVSLKLKPGTAADQVKAVEQAFQGLKAKIPGIKTLHWGTNVSPEKLDKGFTHCFVLTFATEKDRDAYLVHPDHKAFGGVLKPVMGDVFVIDFWAKE